MAEPFCATEWQAINKALAADPAGYGLPERVPGSLLLGSFNIRKLGNPQNRDGYTWQFLAEICRRFDLLAVQEVMDNLDGLRKLMGIMGNEFHMIVSDKTGALPSGKGLGERLAFIYRAALVTRREIATDISYDRSAVLDVLRRNLASITAACNAVDDDEPIKMPVFLTFIRTPFCVSFEIGGAPGSTPYQFMAVNAHLYYGNWIADRRQEFNALVKWLFGRVQENDRSYFSDFILLGDLNMDFDNPGTDRNRIEDTMKTFDQNANPGVAINFPFLDPHPQANTLFRTNARASETFDHIGLFARDTRLPSHDDLSQMGTTPLGPDFGMFDFRELFAQALYGQAFSDLSHADQGNLIARFEYKVSDHLPIWLRLPSP